jgi:hypothetical protein
MVTAEMRANVLDWIRRVCCYQRSTERGTPVMLRVPVGKGCDAVETPVFIKIERDWPNDWYTVVDPMVSAHGDLPMHLSCAEMATLRIKQLPNEYLFQPSAGAAAAPVFSKEKLNELNASVRAPATTAAVPPHVQQLLEELQTQLEQSRKEREERNQQHHELMAALAARDGPASTATSPPAATPPAKAPNAKSPATPRSNSSKKASSDNKADKG